VTVQLFLEEGAAQQLKAEEQQRVLVLYLIFLSPFTNLIPNPSCKDEFHLAYKVSPPTFFFAFEAHGLGVQQAH